MGTVLQDVAKEDAESDLITDKKKKPIKEKKKEVYVSMLVLMAYNLFIHCVEKHDIHIKSKFYKLELLGKLVI